MSASGSGCLREMAGIPTPRQIRSIYGVYAENGPVPSSLQPV